MSAAEFWSAVAVAVPAMLVLIGAGFALGEFAWRVDRSGRRWGLPVALLCAIPVAIAATAAVAFLAPSP